jgi:hypothetical protein
LKYKGFDIVRGSYLTTTDDRADRWYVDDPSDNTIDRRGSGYPTIAEAKKSIDEYVAWQGDR